MITVNILGEKDYFLPEDQQIAQNDFVDLLNDYKKYSPAIPEYWISTYELTYQPLFQCLTAAALAGTKIHILLDSSTYNSAYPSVQKEIQQLAALLKVHGGEITITTAGPGSTQPKQAIWHWKGVVVSINGQSTPNWIVDCWEGSTNFTASGWQEGNSARRFSSTDWANAFIMQFTVHRTWAQENIPQPF